MKEEIKPIYSELRGYLSQAPALKDLHWTCESSLWDQYNQVIDELNNVSGKDYNRFKIKPRTTGGNRGVGILSYRNKLGGLIARLHSEYFSDEPEPFSLSNIPSTVISQTQQQSQSQILLEVQSKIDEKISKFGKDSKEGKFLEKIKNSLPSIRNISQLIILLLEVGNTVGLTVGQILNIFK